MLNEWIDNWETFFSRQWRADLVQVHKVYGENRELQVLGEEFCRRVIGRLLRPLQSGGRRIRPVLCHGDLWDGNVGVDFDTNEPILFDAVCFYGHNEGKTVVHFVVYKLYLGLETYIPISRSPVHGESKICLRYVFYRLV